MYIITDQGSDVETGGERWKMLMPGGGGGGGGGGGVLYT
jgi:hypothetical protein